VSRLVDSLDEREIVEVLESEPRYCFASYDSASITRMAKLTGYARQSSSGMIRRMNGSNSGTVNCRKGEVPSPHIRP
jgi:hypothetical protein